MKLVVLSIMFVNSSSINACVLLRREIHYVQGGLLRGKHALACAKFPKPPLLPS